MKGKTNQYHLSQLNPARITLARELKGFTKKQLAEKIGKTPSAVTQYESGRTRPELTTFCAIALALGVTTTFFAIQNTPEISLSSCHFRANRKTSKTAKRQALQYIKIGVSLYQRLESEGIKLPPVQIPQYELESRSGIEIENFAHAIREEWGVGTGPIPNVLNLLESKGVCVILLKEALAGLDGFSFWHEERPFIALVPNLNKGSRIQFDLAHELAHLVLHSEEDTGDLSIEREANRFAGALLAPTKSFAADCPARWNEQAFLEIKEVWHISMQAALYRARQIGKISESSFRWGMVQISKTGQRTNEKGEFTIAYPSLLNQALSLISNDLSLPAISESLGLSESDVKSLLKEQGVTNDIIASLEPSPLPSSIPIVTLR
ncbi:helix-turn-helix domain-containing protein [Maridesulfovibrio frigidus]|uniref:helix-turn-helix domain-containing protein n=1 Tax=Maridesulfovibrio frigidus TaxID=340956 RepID=UPI000555108F|nr:XRE family transcriptional regulator [Maridesulfovibrio frigidus]